jgi:uncharacterized membrane protein YhhN
MNILIVVFAAGLLAGLLYDEKTEVLKARLAVKIVLSSLFILSAAIQPHPIVPYYRFILTGLIFCLGGDVFLALPRPKMFLCGLVSFLLGHLFYVSDVFVARQRFLKTEFLNRLIGLPLYYSGQFMLAFSVGLLKPAAG